MTLPPSSSEASSSSFHRLHVELRRWVWEQRWTALKDIQERAVPVIMDGARDVILAAATAGGKTEAAFLPILSVLPENEGSGVGCLCVSPLKALINDQHRRLEPLCERVGVALHRRHGDVSADRKQRFLKNPSGVLLITPESLEALFVIHGTAVPGLFATVRYVVIDELHAFIGTERGRQLQSLLHRVELAIRRRVPRIALSATLGDMGLAREFLRPGKAADVETIVDHGDGGQEIKLLLRGYRLVSPALPQVSEARQPQDEENGNRDISDVCKDLFRVLRGHGDHLVFANSRALVERVADNLRELSEKERVPNEFFPHHGSLSKGLREEVESRLRAQNLPTTVVCTNTLELGIDIGDVEGIGQIDAPSSVASLRQRLGRSGRRPGKAAVLRLFAREDEATPQTPLEDLIRAETVQMIAMVELLLKKWFEPPLAGAFHYSTLVQQILSVVAQHGGVKALECWEALCGCGPFANVDRPSFARLLRELGSRDILVQAGDGTLVLGGEGERLVNHYEFYAAFQTEEEFRIVAEGRMIGQIPIGHLLHEGEFIIFEGRRWRVVQVAAQEKVVDVVPAPGGKPPRFGGTRGAVHDEVRKQMRAMYADSQVPRYLDRMAKDLLQEGRDNFQRYGLHRHSIVSDGDSVLFFPWMGDRVMDTVVCMLLSRGFEVSRGGVAIEARNTSREALLRQIAALSSSPALDGAALTQTAANKTRAKYDALLPEPLLDAEVIARDLDLTGAAATLRRVSDIEQG